MTPTELLTYLHRLGVEFRAEGDRLRYSAPKGVLTPDLRTQLVQYKEEILTLLCTASAVPDLPPTLLLSSSKREEGLPLSFAQQRLWFLNQLEPGGIYNISVCVGLTGPLNIGALSRSINEIVRRHEALRTTFVVVDGQPMQMVAPALIVPLPVVDLGALLHPQQETEVRRLASEEADRSFDLGRGPLIRASLLRLSAIDHALLLSLHHIVCDGWSLGVLVQELSALYTAFLIDEPSQLPDLPLQYPDFALWQLKWLRGDVLEQQLSYWKQQLAGAPAVLELPTDHARPAVQAFHGAQLTFELPQVLSEELLALSKRESVTLFMTLLAAFATLLWRYSEQEDIVIGTPIANRTRAELEGLIGFFANTMVMRIDLSGNPSVRELLVRVREVCLGAYAHQELPFEKLVEELQPERELSHSPLFQVMFVLQNTATPLLELMGLKLQLLRVEGEMAKFDLNLIMQETRDGLAGVLEYNTDLFEAVTIERMVAHLRRLLEGMVSASQQRVRNLPLLTEAERQQVLLEWNATQQLYPQQVVLHQLIQVQVASTPDAIALVDEEGQLTYQELDRRANQLAHHLQALGVRPEVLVGICMERSLALVIGLLAIIKAGGAYVPLDLSYPRERLAFMLQDTHMPILLTQAHMVKRLPENTACLVCLDADWLRIAQESTDAVDSGVTPENLAYVIYTSGSTGRPKGVQISQQALTNFLHSMRTQPGVTDCDILLAVTTLSFDIAGLEIFLPLITGARLIIISHDIASDGTRLLEQLINSHATVMQATPATWRLLLEVGWTGSDRLKILCGGEALPQELAFQLLERSPSLWNMYGPTETTIWSTMHRVDFTHRAACIGHPISNTQVYILDQQLQPLPAGVPGELYIGGVGLARGYLNQPEQTAERFVPYPFSPQPGARLYRTGDLARYLPDGSIEFVGRRDEQVKLRGYRIELGEIEATLRQHPAIRDAVVLSREVSPGDKRLVGYVVAEQPPLQLGELRNWLTQRLPDYMIPSAFLQLERLPLTPNGKVDRRKLPTPEWSRAELEARYVAPRGPVEEMLAGVWVDVLKVEQVGVHDNFFALGGHSLLATQVVARLRDVLQMEVPLRTLFESPTIDGLAQRIMQTYQDKQQIATPTIEPRPRNEDLPLSFAQQRLWFLDQLEPGTSTYNIPTAIRLTGALNVPALEQGINEIVRRHEALRTTFEVATSGATTGKPIQVIAPSLTVSVSVIDLCNLPTSQQEEEIRYLASDEGARSFNLAHGPLLRVQLLRVSNADHVLLLNIHHIVYDGWSLGVLVRELSSLYAAFAAGQPSSLLELPLQYGDFAHWQQQWLQGEVLEAHLAYWKQQLAGAPTLLELPTDHPRPAIQTFQGSNYVFDLSPEISEALVALNRREGVTLFMTLLAAFATLLLRYSGQEDIVIGIPIANRQHTELEGLIGFFVNTLVLRIDLSGDPSFRELLGRVRKVALEAYAHQDLPFEKLVEELAPERSLSHSPLFQVLFVQQDASNVVLNLPGLKLQQFDIDNGASKFDVTLFIQKRERRLRGVLEYNTALFDEATICRLAVHLQRLLEGILADQEQPLTALPLLSEAEREQLLITWNATQRSYPTDVCMHHLFEAQVERTPEAIAVVYGDEHLTYWELNRRANRLAHHLQELGVGPDVLVGLFLERSLEVAIGLLATLKAGGAYVPLDPGYPQERLTFMLEDTRAKVVLTQRQLVERFKHKAYIICLDGNEETMGSERTENPRSHMSPENLAYVIFTSGSTGRPKGVSLPHRALVNLLTWHLTTLLGDARTLQFASLSFDASFHEMFAAWCSGGTLFMIPEALRRDIVGLADFLADVAIEKVILPVVVLQQLAVEYGARGRGGIHLKEITTTGEQLHITKPVIEWLKRLEHCPLHNHYGPSESHVVTAFTLPKASDNWPTHPPIGQPIANTQMYVLDSHLRPVPPGVVGELYIGGVSLARGYLGRPGMTAERFIPDPFSAEPGGRLYKTGDLARYLPDGNIEYLGRRDHQVKLRGYRIELEEIESVLSRHQRVRETVVLAREDTPGEKRLVAYVVPNQQQSPTVNELRRYLQAMLPDYMVPSNFIVLDALPLTPNGKLDRRTLPLPDQFRPELDVAFVAPRSDAEEIMARIWRDVLRVKQVGIHDNFFDLGGHSLLATQLVARIRDIFQVELPLRSLFEMPTIDGLTNEIAQAWGGREAVEAVAQTVKELEQLTEEEIKEMLSE